MSKDFNEMGREGIMSWNYFLKYNITFCIFSVESTLNNIIYRDLSCLKPLNTYIQKKRLER